MTSYTDKLSNNIETDTPFLYLLDLCKERSKTNINETITVNVILNTQVAYKAFITYFKANKHLLPQNIILQIQIVLPADDKKNDLSKKRFESCKLSLIDNGQSLAVNFFNDHSSPNNQMKITKVKGTGRLDIADQDWTAILAALAERNTEPQTLEGSSAQLAIPNNTKKLPAELQRVARASGSRGTNMASVFLVDPTYKNWYSSASNKSVCSKPLEQTLNEQYTLEVNPHRNIQALKHIYTKNSPNSDAFSDILWLELKNIHAKANENPKELRAYSLNVTKDFHIWFLIEEYLAAHPWLLPRNTLLRMVSRDRRFNTNYGSFIQGTGAIRKPGDETDTAEKLLSDAPHTSAPLQYPIPIEELCTKLNILPSSSSSSTSSMPAAYNDELTLNTLRIVLTPPIMHHSQRIFYTSAYDFWKHHRNVNAETSEDMVFRKLLLEADTVDKSRNEINITLYYIHHIVALIRKQKIYTFAETDKTDQSRKMFSYVTINDPTIRHNVITYFESHRSLIPNGLTLNICKSHMFEDRNSRPAILHQIIGDCYNNQKNKILPGLPTHGASLKLHTEKSPQYLQHEKAINTGDFRAELKREALNSSHDVARYNVVKSLHTNHVDSQAKLSLKSLISRLALASLFLSLGLACAFLPSFLIVGATIGVILNLLSWTFYGAEIIQAIKLFWEMNQRAITPKPLIKEISDLSPQVPGPHMQDYIINKGVAEHRNLFQHVHAHVPLDRPIRTNQPEPKTEFDAFWMSHKIKAEIETRNKDLIQNRLLGVYRVIYKIKTEGMSVNQTELYNFTIEEILPFIAAAIAKAKQNVWDKGLVANCLDNGYVSLIAEHAAPFLITDIKKKWTDLENLYKQKMSSQLGDQKNSINGLIILQHKLRRNEMEPEPPMVIIPEEKPTLAEKFAEGFRNLNKFFAGPSAPSNPIPYTGTICRI